MIKIKGNISSDFGYIYEDEINVEEVSSVKIISKDSFGKFFFHKDALKRVLEKNNASNLPIVVISVAGPFRTGKSFLLNLFVRYLDAEKKAFWFEGEDDKGFLQLSGFQFKKGWNRETTGIYVCDKVFVTPNKNKSGEVAVVLMDTQGMFDPESSDTENSTIFALSLLLSSMQVYNLKGQIQSDALKHLHLFSNYAGYAAKTHDMKPFQNLYILIRDWEHSEDLIGFSGGEKYLNIWLNNDSSDARKLKDAFEKCFSDIKACLLPHPGGEITKLSTGVKSVQISDIDQQFKTHIKEFVVKLVKRENLVVKTYNYNQLRTDNFIDLVEQHVEVYNGKSFPSVESQAEMLDKSVLKSIFDELKTSYHSNIRDRCKNKVSNNSELMTEYHSFIDELVDSIKHKSEKDKEKVKEMLKKDLLKDLESLQKLLSAQIKFKKTTFEMLSRNFSVNVDKQLIDYKMNMSDYCKKYVDTNEKLVKIHSRYKLRFKKALQSDCEKETLESFKYDFNIKQIEKEAEMNKFLTQFRERADDHFRDLEKLLIKEKNSYEQEIARQNAFYEKAKLSIEKKNRDLIKKSKKEICDEDGLNEVSEAVTERTNELLEEKLECPTEYFYFFFPLRITVKNIREKAILSIKKTSIEKLGTLRKHFNTEIKKLSKLTAEAEQNYRSTYKLLKKDYIKDFSCFIEQNKYGYFNRVIRQVGFLDFLFGFTIEIEKKADLIKIKANELKAKYLMKYGEETSVDSFNGNDEFEFGIARVFEKEKEKCKEEVKKAFQNDCTESKYNELESFNQQQKSCTIQ